MSRWEDLGGNPLSRNDATSLFQANSMGVAGKPQPPHPAPYLDLPFGLESM